MDLWLIKVSGFPLNCKKRGKVFGRNIKQGFTEGRTGWVGGVGVGTLHIIHSQQNSIPGPGCLVLLLPRLFSRRQPFFFLCWADDRGTRLMDSFSRKCPNPCAKNIWHHNKLKTQEIGLVPGGALQYQKCKLLMSVVLRPCTDPWRYKLKIVSSGSCWVTSWWSMSSGRLISGKGNLLDYWTHGKSGSAINIENKPNALWSFTPV